mgnify:FL=1
MWSYLQDLLRDAAREDDSSSGQRQMPPEMSLFNDVTISQLLHPDMTAHAVQVNVDWGRGFRTPSWPNLNCLLFCWLLSLRLWVCCRSYPRSLPCTDLSSPYVLDHLPPPLPAYATAAVHHVAAMRAVRCAGDCVASRAPAAAAAAAGGWQQWRQQWQQCVQLHS